MSQALTRTSNQNHFLAGLRAVSPLLLGVFPFATVSGVAASAAGLSVFEAFFMSIGIFAGASQLASVQLIADQANALVIVLTAVVINARMAMYSASIAPHFWKMARPARAILSYFLTDQAYAVSITRYHQEPALTPRDKASYYIGAGFALWLTWQVGTGLGLVLGAQVPASWSLDFAIPLTFMALVMPAIRTTPALAAAVAAVALAVAAYGLPYNLGLLVAALGGILTGVVAETLGQRETGS